MQGSHHHFFIPRGSKDGDQPEVAALHCIVTVKHLEKLLTCRSERTERTTRGIIKSQTSQTEHKATVNSKLDYYSHFNLLKKRVKL